MVKAFKAKNGVKVIAALGLLSAVCLFLYPGFALSQNNQDSVLFEAAQKEGELVYYTTMTLSQSQKIVERFERKYPLIKVRLLRTGGGPLLDRILTEGRAGMHTWDVVVGRGEMVLPLMQAKLLAPYRSPETRMIDADLVDNEGYWTAYYVNPYVLGYNTRLVRGEEVPKTYDQLLQPRWSGRKISIDTEDFGLLAGLIRAWGKEKAVSYLKKLAAQEPVPMRGNTNRVQLTAAGEYPLVLAYAPTIQRETSQGAPVDWVALEPVVVQVQPVMLAAKARHPNAAKLFINFVLSEEGQKMLVGMRRIPVRRNVDADPPRLTGGYRRIVLDPESYKNFSDIVKLYKDIFDLG
jgi:iron(III) transport system substrate-binding protein